MAAEGEGYLPPVIVNILADDSDFLAKIAADKAALADFAKTITKTQLSADDKPFTAKIGLADTALKDFAKKVTSTNLDATDKAFVSKLAQAQTALASFAKEVASSRLGVDTKEFWLEIESIKTLLHEDPATLDIDADIAPALLKIAELRGALKLASIDTLAQALTPGFKSGNFSAIDSALASWGKSEGSSTGDAFAIAMDQAIADHKTASDKIATQLLFSIPANVGVPVGQKAGNAFVDTLLGANLLWGSGNGSFVGHTGNVLLAFGLK